MMFRFPKSLSKVLRTQRKISKLFEVKVRAPRRKAVRTTNAIFEMTSKFGSNPGRLLMKSFAAQDLLPKSPLVVVLHGCRQTPESFDAASGITRLAKARGFAVLFPQQTASNNPHRCFNWFRPSAVARDRGELLSIKQMIAHACSKHRCNRSRVFIVGLSAGGAMAAALVANYPDTFAGAAFVAGMPVGSARDALSALGAMNRGATAPSSGWGSNVTGLSDLKRSYPPISVWQGTLDTVVNPKNADAMLEQWLQASNVDPLIQRTETKSWGTRRTWGAKGSNPIVSYSIKGMGHGFPVKRTSRKSSGAGDPYVLAAGVSAPLELMHLWGI
nr:PHB depolymerase family esterase [Rhizobium sp. 2MFCol3.1]